jgi:hypothetical protein
MKLTKDYPDIQICYLLDGTVEGKMLQNVDATFVF